MNSNFDYNLEPGKVLSKIEYSDYKKIISIVTPTWNPTNYLLQTANCILNQSYPYFEWLIIDDGSTNKDSLRILAKIEKMDSRIKIYHKKNEGLSKTRDYGVSKTSHDTDYVVFIDDDDLLDKTYLEIAYFSMCANPGASWCYSDVVNFQGQQSLWNKIFSSKKMKKENLLVSQAMIKKSAFYDVGGFTIGENGHYEDWIFWLKLMGKGHYPIHLSFYGFWYRRKENAGQLKLATSMHKRNMKEVKYYSDFIVEDVVPIEYPRENFNWEHINEYNENFIVPKFKNNNKSNILVIVPWMTVGGADKFNLDLFKRIDKSKFSITLVTCQPTEYIWRQHFEQCCDYVYDLSTFIDRKDWLSFINYLIQSRNIDIIFNTNSVTGYMMLPYLNAKYPKIPIIDYIHMEEWYNRNGGYSRDSAAVGSVIDRTLFCNKNSENILVNYFKRDKDSVSTVYIGVDTSKFDPQKYDRDILRKKYDVDSNQFVVGLIARIDYQKRPFLLMKIIEKTIKNNNIENLLFIIAGDGPLLPAIKDIAIQKKIDKYIKFLGATNKPVEIYSISDVTLNCSIKEGLALTSYESLSMGIPVISSDVGGQKELINEETGVIVPCLQDENQIHNFNYSEEEIENYVKAIEKVYKNIISYKNKCRKRILNSFTIEHMVENMEKEFEMLLKSPKDTNDETKNINIYIELLNQYFLGDKSLYNWLCNEYNRKIYGYVEKNDNNVSLKNRIGNKFWKYRLYRCIIKFYKKIRHRGDNL